ncbi:MAG: DNA polymerase III subunit beta [Candidatus Nealsonbacteria bacterium RIFCSPHIGHO2_01_FULL_43_31]|uniref:Beta sliding clamp n=2 Tax=Candidatus Nealsoniibacteriota TaxID=1817911 RepID=A0A1G2E725_9BACT|nr:MAG: polymerase III subunit beta protein [Parcubacteria group bacterium GW2011_GWB1_43_6]OGZ20458.1 MAG: DNA polymerase III subunit beta [Candidatus Nealsonbacteria bacterium RIFCSPHIGHO2_01_FULL_43_31]OGZ21051.1 MAG: DNA polymerase III subunit beta [Candidatus Nealsonbacteria bacterium RIFCSPHIGHO2_02_FULL_43_13]OGZ25434.1 MAG: DNA polymerase III subunit beta [Candidatus Nealsonbacteria bacterium RIFCSPLOWO2_01_FULL_43_36]
MKIIILKDNLYNGLNIIGRIAGKNLTLPILNNILIETEGSFINLSSTDLELGIKYWLLAKIEKEGKITVPSKIFTSFIGLLPNKKLTLEAKNQTLSIDCDDQSTQIKGLDAQDYPIIPTIGDKDFIGLDVASFCEGLAQVVDFAAVNQARPELSGIYLNFQKDRVQLTATDSVRLAEKTVFLKEKTEKSVSFILPQKTAREIINIFTEQKGRLKLYSSPNQVLFEYPMTETDHPQIQVVSRLVEGEYPDYQGIIPQKHEAQIILTKNDFLNQVKTASIFSGRSNEVQIRINSKKEGVEILSQNPELGENKSFLPAKIVYGQEKAQEMAVKFNYRFLVDGLLNIKSPQVVFELNGEDGPAVLKPAEDQTYIYVVMPIKTT